MPEVHVCRNLERLACKVRRGDIRRACDRPKWPKGAHTAPRGSWSNLRALRVMLKVTQGNY